VTLSDVLVTDDMVDARLDVLSVAVTTASAAGGETCDTPSQVVSCTIPTLAVSESVTITVTFEVDSSEPEALDVPNMAEVAGEAPQGDPGDPGDDITDEDDDTINILVDIDLSIVKTFDPTAVPQGTLQSFTIEVSNAGPSDAVDVSVTDTVHDSLAVTDVTVTSGDGDCTASVGQEVDCTVQIPAEQSVLITVDYTAAPFQTGAPLFGTLNGSEFRFVFVNGSVLEGTASGDVFLDGVPITPGDTKNDYLFDPPGVDPAFLIHLSCSDPFTGGWGQTSGPVEGVDDNWQIAFFSIARYKDGDFFRNCGNVVNPFDVPNTATATGTDSFGTESVSDDATVTIEPGITIDKLQTNGKRVTVRLTNFTAENKEIVDISIEWPSSNADLEKVRLDDPTVWSGSFPPPSAFIDGTTVGWNGGTLFSGEAILRFDFANKVAETGHTIRVNFTDGTFLDIFA
jgi:uncharacterized repeat protein (TIGR01451 family)